MCNLRQIYTILGSGADLAGPRRMASSHLLQADADAVMIDTGRGCLSRLWDLGVNPLNIRRVCLTHFHADHTGELVSWLMGQYHDGNSQKLHLMGGAGLKVWWRCLCAVWPSLERLERFDMLELAEIDAGGSITWGPWQVETLAVYHKPESIAYKFTLNNSAVVISGDTGVCGGLSAFAYKADLLALECGAGLAGDELTHLNVTQAAQIAREAHAKNLVIHHIRDDAAETELADAVKSVYNNPFYIASDLLQVEV